MSIEISIPKILVKPVLWFTGFFSDQKFVLVCKGYNDDWNYYTGLYWCEDKDMDVNWYEAYQLWINYG